MGLDTDAHIMAVAALVGVLIGAVLVAGSEGEPLLSVGVGGVVGLLASGFLLGRLWRETGARNECADRSRARRVAAPRTDGGAAGSEMEMIVAIVRPGKLTEVKQALVEAGAPSLTVTNVSGRGSQPEKTGEWHGEEYVVDLHQKIKVEVVVADVPAERVAEAIREAAHTGEPGDGKVFVLPVSDALQVRTGTRGTEAV